MADDPRTDFAAAERLLAEADFAGCRPLWSSSNFVYLATMTGTAGEFAAVYKPHRGEAPLWDFPDGLYRREAAAYRFAELLGWHFIPPTIVRDGPEGPGSLQVFIPHDPASNFFTQRDDPVMVPQLQRMSLFDAAANNADRKGGHCLLDSGGQVWGIDHGLCFHQQYKLRSVIWDWAGEPVAAEWLADLERAGCAIEAKDDSAGPLLELLAPAEAVALASRIKRLVGSAVFPSPGPGRHYPWPLV